MRKLLYSFLFFIFLHSAVFAQTASTYCFSSSTATYNSLTSFTIPAGMPTGANDDAISNSVPMTFNFVFGGIEYSQLKISNNGWITFGNATDPFYENNSTQNINAARPVIAPFWDDLRHGNNSAPRYSVTGSTGSRIFKVEWLQQFFYSGNTGDVISFQVWLYEGSNKIEFRYRQGNTTPGVTVSATIGIFDAIGTHQTLNNASNAPVSQVGTITPNINSRPATGQVYTYIPFSISTQSGSDVMFCIDNTNVQTRTVGNGQYALVNIIKGYNYTFEVPNVFTGSNAPENLILTDTSNNTLSPYVASSGNGGTSLTWTATFSGQIKVFLASTCGLSGSNTMTLTLNSIGDKEETQNEYGNNQWIGHIYNFTGGAPPGGYPSPTTVQTTNPFASTQYAGYYPVNSETINESFGGDYTCFPVYSQGSQRASIYTETYAVRYKMKTTKNGCYLITVWGDDGVRLYLNGQNVLDRWVEQGSTTYSNILVRFDGDDDLIFDYYENGGNNTVGFSMVRLDAANPNSITAPSVVNFCPNGDPDVIDGSLQYNSNDPNMQNPQLNFQWQISTDGSIFADILGATGRTYDPPAIANATAVNIVRRFKRLVTLNTANIPNINGVRTSCSYPESNIVTITTTPGAPSQPGAITPPANTCAGSTGNTFSVATVSGATSYTWSVSGTGWLVTAGANTASATITIGTGTGSVSVTATNACGTSSAQTLSNIIPTAAPSQPGAITPPANTCANSTGNTFSIAAVSGATSYTWSVTGTGWSVTAGTNTTSATITIGTGTGNVSVTATNACGTSTAQTLSNIVPTAIPSQPGAITPPANTCANSTGNTFSIAAVSGATSYTWSVSGTGWLVTAGANTASATITIGTGTGSVSVTATNACGTSSAQTLSNIIPTAAPSQPGAITPPANTCANSTGNTFSIAAVSGATSYTWSVTGTGWSVTAGTNTTSATITIGTGTGNVSVTATNACGTSVAQSTGSLLATTNSITLTSATGTDAQNVCANTAITDITYSTNGATGVDFGVLPAGISGIWSGNVVRISGTATVGSATPYTYTVTLLGGCGNISATGTITVKPLPTTPTITKNNDAACNTLGSITLSGLPADWTITRTGVTTSTHPYTGTTSTLPIQDLAADTYSFTVTNNATGCTSSPATVTITDTSSNTEWNGSAWSNDEPDGSKSVTISSVVPNQPFTIAKPNIQACSLTITATSDVIVPNGVTLTITNKVTTNGNLVFESGSSLLQTTNVQNQGTIVYKRTTKINRFDLTYWSSPVTGELDTFKMKDLSSETLFDKFFTYSPTGGWATNMYGMAEMERGKGYSIRGPQSFDTQTPADFTGEFKGRPNNGDITVPSVVPDKWFLLGNPYPSAIDVDALWDANKDVLGALYFWTHVAPPTKAPGDNTYRYTSNDYVVYTASGGTVVSGTKSFDGFIAAGQGFFARPKTTEIHFNNDMRRGSSVNGSFFKVASKSKSIERNRIWLNMVNNEGAFKQILVGYIEGATNNVDFNYDAPTIAGNSYLDFYSLNETKKLTIQGRALPFENTDLVPLGYKTTVAGDFTIGIDHGDGFFGKQEVYLEDKTTGKTINLRNENYTFSTLVGTFTDRFVLRYTGKTLGTDDLENLENSVLISVKNKTVSITCSKETIKDVTIFNVGAQLVYSKNKVNSSELQITNLHSSDQVLLVKVTLENGSTITKKVIFSNL